MPTIAIPTTIDPLGTKEVWPQLDAFVKARKPGDIVQAPANAKYKCDKPLQFEVPGVEWYWNGTQFRQTSLRPYGAYRNDGVISPDGWKVSTADPLPSTCNWGYVTGPGIHEGTQMIFDPNTRTVAKLSAKATPGTGLALTFTSKADRLRCGFRIMPTCKDFAHHDWTWFGPVADPPYIRYLEAQHGTDLQGAGPGLLDNGSARNMYGDGIYFGRGGGKITTYVEAQNGVIDNCARSGVVPMDCDHCSVHGYLIDHVGRTACDIEPFDASCHLDNWAMYENIIGFHQLTLMSSGGDTSAYVGRVEFARNEITKSTMSLWLIVGNKTHRRGPYIISGNHTSSPTTFGGSYPTAALVAVANSRGATVTDNTGIKLQVRSPVMAVCRAKEGTNTGPVEVHGNQQTGGIEVGPWINP